MIHVITVHFQSDKWIDVQLAYLRRNITEPYRVVANLEDVPGGHEAKFDLVVEAKRHHSGKLNLLAAEVSSTAHPDDLLMFIDGDAFPISDPMPLVHKALEESTLVAVRRDENNGDRQPHPCFAVISVRDWDRLHGDWSPGYCWPDDRGRMVTDTGGNFLAALDRSEEPWTPILRSNRHNAHPLWFAIYGDVVYHHGAGFRDPMSRTILDSQSSRWPAGEKIPVVGGLVRKANKARFRHWKTQQVSENRRMLDEVFDQIVADPEFYRRFL